jgi:hypothetical protein
MTNVSGDKVASVFRVEDNPKEVALRIRREASSPGLFLVLYFDPEDGGDIFLQNVGRLLPDCTTLYPIRQNGRALHSHCCESLRSSILYIVLQTMDHSGRQNTLYKTHAARKINHDLMQCE